MKFGFDEHIAPAVVDAIRKLLENEKDRSIQIALARDLAEPPQKSDVPWLKKFAEQGGQVVITGDRKMRGKLHEQQALSELGLIAFFFPSEWNNWDNYTRSSFLLRWWPAIVAKARESKPGDRWEMKATWVSVGEFRDVKTKAKQQGEE